MTEAGVVAEEAHDRKLLKSLVVCQREGIHFVPLAWESTGGATETVNPEVDRDGSARSGYPAKFIRSNLYSQISVSLQRSLAQAVIDRQVELGCERVL